MRDARSRRVAAASAAGPAVSAVHLRGRDCARLFETRRTARMAAANVLEIDHFLSARRGARRGPAETSMAALADNDEYGGESPVRSCLLRACGSPRKLACVPARRRPHELHAPRASGRDFVNVCRALWWCALGVEPSSPGLGAAAQMYRRLAARVARRGSAAEWAACRAQKIQSLSFGKELVFSFPF